MVHNKNIIISRKLEGVPPAILNNAQYWENEPKMLWNYAKSFRSVYMI